MKPQRSGRVAALLTFVVLSATVAGYFTGLQSPVPPHRSAPPALTGSVQDPREPATADDDRQAASSSSIKTLPATEYLDLPRLLTRSTRTNLTALPRPQSVYPTLPDIQIAAGQKQEALRQRGENRAFNGAPPTVPHPIQQRSDQSCLACHQHGVKMETLRIPQMSHPLLTNCTQCHVPSGSVLMTSTDAVANDFLGRPAPDGGHRAFAGAPPVIPHSAWMRQNCNSCHGPAGLQGIRTTHPWRKNCTQCHAQPAKQDQLQPPHTSPSPGLPMMAPDITENLLSTSQQRP